MKKTTYISSFLLLAFFVSTFGVYLVFHLQKNMLRHEIAEYIRSVPEPELVKISFPAHSKTAEEWKSGREVEYQHHLYDIVRYEENEDEVVFYCFPDAREESLSEVFSALIQQQFSDTPKNSKSKQLHFFKLLSSFIQPSALQINFSPDSDNIVYLYSNNGYNQFPELADPPPPRF